MTEANGGGLISGAVIGLAFWSCFLLTRLVMVVFALAASQIGAVPLGLVIVVLGPLILPLSIAFLYRGDNVSSRL